MAAYRRVYDSRHPQADCKEPGSAPEPYTLGNRVSIRRALCWTVVFWMGMGTVMNPRRPVWILWRLSNGKLVNAHSGQQQWLKCFVTPGNGVSAPLIIGK